MGVRWSVESTTRFSRIFSNVLGEWFCCRSREVTLNGLVAALRFVGVLCLCSLWHGVHQHFQSTQFCSESLWMGDSSHGAGACPVTPLVRQAQITDVAFFAERRLERSGTD